MVSVVHDRHLPVIRPLTARSVVLSTLLGYHPPALPASALVRVGALFGIAERTTRVALTRMVAAGDVIADGGLYRLTTRLIQRQAQQDESCSPQTKPWNGSWEMAVVTAISRSLADRVALRKSMVPLRLAQFREGVWLRPANLLRQPGGLVADQCAFFDSRPEAKSLELARSLWDLEAWAAAAEQLRRQLDSAAGLKAGFIVSAEVLRHLLIDPCLPAELLPGHWPAAGLRERYAEFSAAYAEQLRDYSRG